MSRHFYQQFRLKELQDALHVRVDDKDDIKEFARYRWAKTGRISGAGGYHFMSTDRSRVLPAPSLLPYETCFIDPPEYERLNSGLSSTTPEHVRAVLGSMYELLARKIKTFSLNEDGKLALPTDYASLRI